MAIELTVRADLLSKKVKKEPQIILEIPGLPDVIFGAITVTKIATIGQPGLKIGNFKIGGIVTDERSKEYISFNGTTKSITQQLIPDQGGAGTVARLNIRLVDKNDELTALFQPGANISDMLGQRAIAYLNMKGGAHPDDSIKLLDARIDDYDAGAGFIDLKLAAPEQYKRTNILPKIDTTLDGDIDDTTTTIVLASRADELILPQDALTSFVLIDDEIIQFTGVSGQTLTGVTRGALDSIAVAHSDEASISTIYQLLGDTITLVLKVMLSDGGNAFATDVPITNFNQVTPSLNVQNAIGFNLKDVKDFYGLSVGDKVTSAGAINGANNFTDRLIVSFGQSDNISYIVVGGASLVDEADTTALLELTSKFNTLPEDAGCGMTPQQVDVKKHLDIFDLLFANFPDYDFRFNETVKAQDLINKEMYRPSGLYQIPRARASANITLPPISGQETLKINLDNVQNPEKLKINRSATNNFYNKVVYRFNHDVLRNELRSSYQKSSPESKLRIPVKNRTLNIRALGIREDDRPFVVSQASNLLNRYQFGAESIKQIDVNYNEGLRIEIGDPVLLEGESLRLSDSTNGTRNFLPRLFEVVNKRMSIQTGDISLDILDTGFDLEGRFGTVSPSAEVQAGSTTTLIKIENIFGAVEGVVEASRWERYIGEEILVRSDDYSISDSSIIKRIHPTLASTLELETALAFTPSAGYIFESKPYPQTTSKDEMSLWKTQHVYLTPQVAVVSGASQTVFDVGAGDIGRFYVGAPVRLHNSDYSSESIQTKVDSINVNTITVDDSLGFTPDNTYVVELIGFLDEGSPYKVI